MHPPDTFWIEHVRFNDGALGGYKCCSVLYQIKLCGFFEQPICYWDERQRCPLFYKWLLTQDLSVKENSQMLYLSQYQNHHFPLSINYPIIITVTRTVSFNFLFYCEWSLKLSVTACWICDWDVDVGKVLFVSFPIWRWRSLIAAELGSVIQLLCFVTAQWHYGNTE